ncbi:UNVERIFIED_CONTAM: hypothetical protein GTU68_027195 [Idotea baltica]|nr:hypothetical protein [Idotea baltica]
MEDKIGIIGLGYVGLPLAVEFGKKYDAVGYDINKSRIEEVDDEYLKSVLKKEGKEFGLHITDDPHFLDDCNIYIITVPTPTDRNNRPVLVPLQKASEVVGKYLKNRDIVIYESTVYPGATEEECIPILEEVSNLKFNTDFYVGYSPERINPGDKERTVTKILKVTSGSTPESAEKIDNLYKSVITAGTFKASSIKVAEAAKVIENSQRDINIAFVNELAKIFNKLGIDTLDVLEAAGTKWNFLPFKPGLVGGHCIGVDPYYLAQKAQEVGYHPEIILAGRRLNDTMGQYVASEVVKLMIGKDIRIKNATVLIFGFTFKENCPDIRNTRIIDVFNELLEYGLDVAVFDPWANEDEVMHEYGIKIIKELVNDVQYDAGVLAVSHHEFKKLDIKKHIKNPGILYDVKGFLSKDIVDGRL